MLGSKPADPLSQALAAADKLIQVAEEVEATDDWVLLRVPTALWEAAIDQVTAITNAPQQHPRDDGFPF